MQVFAKTWVWVTLLAAIAVFGHVWMNGLFWVGSAGGLAAQTSSSVPAPEASQKKVVLRKLGMA